MGINPQQRGNRYVGQMKKNWDPEEKGRLSRGSGMRGEKLLQELKSLEELDIELETSEDKVASDGYCREDQVSEISPEGWYGTEYLGTEGSQKDHHLAKPVMLLGQYAMG